jgi:hypothetical protein
LIVGSETQLGATRPRGRNDPIFRRSFGSGGRTAAAYVLRQINREHSYTINNACRPGMRIRDKRGTATLCFCPVLDSKKAIGTFKQFQRSRSIIRMDYFSDGVGVRSGVRDENWKGQQNNFQENFYLYDTARFFALLMR